MSPRNTTCLARKPHCPSLRPSARPSASCMAQPREKPCTLLTRVLRPPFFNLGLVGDDCDYLVFMRQQMDISLYESGWEIMPFYCATSQTK
jgi:hypothetical protein